jgi:lipoprotein-releasing system permease protein
LYKLLLCWRYLLTRYLAMVCIVSVMLGVATLIVVNSVMSGFSSKLRDRLHGLLSDVVVEAWDYDGFPDPEGKMDLIRNDPFLRERIAAMTPTLEIFAMIQFNWRGTPMTRPVRLIGIDPEGRAQVGGFAEHLMLHRNHPTFSLSPEARQRYEDHHQPRVLGPDGWPMPAPPDVKPASPPPLAPGEKPAPDPTPSTTFVPESVIVGYAIAHFRDPASTPDAPREIRTLEAGDDVILTTVSGQRLSPVWKRYTVCDYFRSEMSEYDANYVFVPLEDLQQMRTMQDRATSILISLKNYEDAKPVVERLQALFATAPIQVQTWEAKQGPLLAAIRIEKGILNVLLFLIIAVAGFGILAIFSMIVVEKTRDIGILKALGASNGGILKIFIGYGFLLGVVGATLGTSLGLVLTTYINEVEHFLARTTGQEIFPKSVYYFDKIPTDIQTFHVVLINFGALSIAVLFSILPALRAALLHPVRALRYE